jgi:monoterpene epsilon-lactone hydrolase
MASPEFNAYQERMAANPPPPPATLPETRARIDAAMSQIPLADGASAAEVDAGGVHAILCTRAEGDTDPTFIYFHGGGYRLGSALAYRAYGTHLATVCKAKVLLVDYRLAPEDPFPAAVDDALAVYEWVLGQGVPAAQIVLGGDSAGGGLTAALLIAAQDRTLPLPAGAVLLSPWVDLTNTAHSYQRNGETDKMFSLTSATDASALYVGEHDRKDPLVSPLFGSWSGMPPLLIQVGSIETLLDDAAELASVAAAAGVDVEHHVFAEMPHVWQINYPAFPEAVDAVTQIGAFVSRVTGA